jgi:AraC family transcriptional regulator
MTQTADFISQVPDGVLKSTKICPCGSIVLFKPTVYMGGVTFNVSDYHIVIPSEITPAAMINNKLVHGNFRKIMTVNPGDTVSCYTDSPAKPYYSLLVKSGLLRRVAEEMDFSGEIRFEHVLNPFSMELFRLLRGLDLESGRPDRLTLLLDCLEVQIAAALLREYRTNMTQPALSEDAEAYVNIARDFIREYFSSNITLKEICDEIHVSPYHFIRMFKKHFGLTPHRYLLQVRVEKAKELLATGRYSVGETAELCGFESAPHFSDTFRKTTGCSPGEYRSKCS